MTTLTKSCKVSAFRLDVETEAKIQAKPYSR